MTSEMGMHAATESSMPSRRATLRKRGVVGRGGRAATGGPPLRMRMVLGRRDGSGSRYVVVGGVL